jgi:hypothetical protein
MGETMGEIQKNRQNAKANKLGPFQKKPNEVLIEVYNRCEQNETIRALIDGDPKLKIHLNSIIAKDKYDAPWFTTSIIPEAHQLFNCDDIPQTIREIDARIDALEAINHELIGMGYNALKDFKFVSTVYSMILSELYTIKDITATADTELRMIAGQQEKAIGYANEFLSKRSWPRIMTYVSTITASLGVTMAAFASNLKQLVENVAGSSNVAMVVGTGAFVLSTVLFATGKLTDFFVNRSIRNIMAKADRKAKSILRWQEAEINWRLFFLRNKVIEIGAKCRYFNDVKKEAPEIAKAIDDGDWGKINRWVDEAIQQGSSKTAETPVLSTIADIASVSMARRARAEIGGLDGSTAAPDKNAQKTAPQ